MSVLMGNQILTLPHELENKEGCNSGVPEGQHMLTYVPHCSLGSVIV